MIEIGTGGGSIARVDALRRLLAGPDSAGAVPGPAAGARGTAFVFANYPLCPEVTLPELLDACRRCVVDVRDHAQSWAATRRACSCPATRRAVT